MKMKDIIMRSFLRYFFILDVFKYYVFNSINEKCELEVQGERTSQDKKTNGKAHVFGCRRGLLHFVEERGIFGEEGESRDANIYFHLYSWYLVSLMTEDNPTPVYVL